MKYYNEVFENVPALKRALDRPLNKIWRCTTPSTEHMEKDFHGASTFSEALSLFENGDMELAKKIEKINLPNFSSNNQKKITVYSPVGGTVCIPKFLAGIPYCMRRKKKTTSSDKVISLYYNASVSCQYDADEVLAVNKKLVSMVNSLTLSGYSIQVYYISLAEAYAYKSVYSFVYKLKSFQESFNIARTAFVLGNPAMLRGIWFKYIEHSPFELESRFAYGYGRPHYPSKQELVNNGILKENDFLIDFQKLRKAKEATDLLK